MFLGAKMALLLPTVYLASLDLAYWHTTTYSIGAQYIQLISTFTMGLFGLRWILLDQRTRCPCLPAQGDASSASWPGGKNLPGMERH